VHPTIAAIEGACIGGGLEIACRCDLRICGQSARLGVPINRLGFAMAPRELEGLIALTGRAIALELLLEGGIFDAFEAQSKHLVTRVVPDARVVLETWESARRIAAGAPLAARINKRMVRRLASPAAPLSADEISFAYSYAHSADHAEGVGAFLGGREPRFTGT
jgi:enoyl-CoA hydratase/carnithine racemase